MQGTSYSEVGGLIVGASKEERLIARQGHELFGQAWLPDPAPNRYNATHCFQCHLLPAHGGTSRDPSTLVHMVPSDDNPSGFENYQRNEITAQKSSERPVPANAEVRRALPLFGIGYLEAVPDEEILKRADPHDLNHDGISGRALPLEGRGIGRFGWKGNFRDVESFARNAFKTELGVSLRTFATGDKQSLTEEKIRTVSNFLRLLSPVMPRPSADSDKGKAIFESIGCAECHIPTLRTGDQSPFEILRNREFHPYTDLLLHDIGPGEPVLEDGPRVSKREFRTMPLWGMGSIGPPYWNDMSAKDVESAIQKHEGEALKSRTSYRKLSPADQESLKSFLMHL